VIVGALIVLQGFGGYAGNFVLLNPVMRATGGFVANAAAHESRVRLAVLVGLAAGVMMLAIAITIAPVIRRQSESFANWFIALSSVAFALSAVEHIGLLTMLAVSKQMAAAGGATEALSAAGELARASRNGTHYTGLLVVGGSLLVFYGTLFRFRLVPRALAAFGVLAALMQATAVSMPLLGRPINLQLLSPLGIAQLSLAIWLLVKGLKEQDSAR